MLYLHNVNARRQAVGTMLTLQSRARNSTHLYVCHVHAIAVPDFLELKPVGLKTGMHVLAIIFEYKRMGSSSRREVRILLYFEFTHVGLISNIYINFVYFLKLRACAYYRIHAAI